MGWMKRKATARRARHLDEGGRVFMPLSRMCAIRWEEAVERSRLRRDGLTLHTVIHGTCHCGSIDCVGVPWVQGRKTRS